MCTTYNFFYCCLGKRLGEENFESVTPWPVASIPRKESNSAKCVTIKHYVTCQCWLRIHSCYWLYFEY